MMLNVSLALLGISTLLASCRAESPANEVKAPAPAPPQPALVSATLLGRYTPEQLRARYGGAAAVLKFLTRYGIRAYRLVYTTTGPDGKPVRASGAVLLPDSAGTLPILSMQHGTITSDAEAPSNYQSGSEVYQVGSVFASTGYVVAAPDYIGYGASKDVAHPYEHRATLAQASYDMLRATQEFLKQESVRFDGRLFLAGYSEGGYATLALQQKLEQQPLTDATLVASSAGAGAYDKPAFMEHVLGKRSVSSPSYVNRLYLWVLLTYDRVYGLNRPMTYYFKEPYASQIARQGRSASISVSFDKIISDEFRQAIASGKDVAFLRAIEDNDLHDWRPTTPTRLYHGDADQTVPFFNSQNAFDAMRARGAQNVTLHRLPGRTHATAIPEYVLGTFQFFASAKVI